MVHTLRLDNYTPIPRKLVLGTNSSFGTESIKIERGAGWDGLNLTATWHIPGREEPLRVALLDGDAMDVPPEVTKEAKDGVLVLAGLASGVQRASCNVEYLIIEQAGVYGGADAEPTPELAAQVLEATMQAKSNAEAAAQNASEAKANANKAQENAEKAQQAAENAAEDAAKAGPYAETALAAARAAKASENTAKVSENAAAASAVAAAGSAAQAETQKTAAEKSASDAQGYMQTASGAAIAANASAENAAVSKAAAASSATAAAGSATVAAGDAKTASVAAAGATDAKAAAVAAQKDAAASKAAAANSAIAAKTSEDAAAKSAADADRTANSIKDSMTQIAANKEAVSRLKEDLSDVNNSISTTADAYTMASVDMESGTIDKITGVDGESNNTIRSKDFVDISSTKSFSFSGISANAYYVRIVYYDSSKAFLNSTDGFKANEEAVRFVKPNKAKYMRIVIAYISLDSIDYIKPVITYTNLIDGDTITRSVKKGKFKTFQNDWEILEGKWADIPSGQTLKRTDSRNSCTANFLHAKKGDELILQSPISFSIMLFSEADETTCFYNSYKDGVYYSGYKFNSDCYFLLNFTNQQDLSAETKKSDIVWTKNTVKDVQTVFIVPNAEYSTIHVASAWASDEEKSGADYVCDGVNDGEELQQAIYDLRARGGGVLKLSNERYIIDTLFDRGIASVGKYGIYIPTNNYNVSLIKIEGVNFPNVIQPMYFGHCARLDMSQDLYNSLGKNEIVSIIGVEPVISGSGKVSRSSVGCTLSIENVAINIPAPQKKIIGVNCEYAYNMQLKGVHCGLTEYAGDPQEPNGKIINSNIDCIGIRTLYGYNWGSGYHIDDCNVRGWGLGFDISGEHLIMQNACARFVNTGFRFGHFGDDTMMSHPNTLINCCEEWLLHGMALEGNGLGQSLNIIDFNIEDMTNNGWGRKTYAKESKPGSYHGTLTYTTTRDSYKNAPHKFWEDGSGINVLTRDLNDKFSGTTENRPQSPQNNQQYFDTTLNKMLYYINNNWVDAMGEVIN